MLFYNKYRRVMHFSFFFFSQAKETFGWMSIATRFSFRHLKGHLIFFLEVFSWFVPITRKIAAAPDTHRKKRKKILYAFSGIFPQRGRRKFGHVETIKSIPCSNLLFPFLYSSQVEATSLDFAGWTAIAARWTLKPGKQAALFECLTFAISRHEL